MIGKWNQPPKKRIVHAPRPPVGWSCSDPSSFNAQVRETLDLPAVQPVDSSIASSHTLIFTDGSYACSRMRAKQFAGWGYAIWDYGIQQREDLAAFVGYGGVITAHAHHNYLGAEKHSNNTGEITAAIEAFIRIIALHTLDINDPMRRLVDRHIILYTDSN